jgi:hypothetical protein
LNKDANKSGKHFAYLLAELVKGEWFCDKIDAWIEHTVMNHCVARISRRGRHVEIRTQFDGHFSHCGN